MFNQSILSTDNSLTCDVLVIGSGPGGSATAISCAMEGLKVILIEAKSFPRSHPGETLHPGIEPLLKQLGVIDAVLAAGFLRHQGNWVQWEGECKFVPFAQEESEIWYGFQAWRCSFDKILLHRAQALGVKILQPCQARRLIINNRKIIGVETSQGVIKASKIVDAAGSNHWLAKQLKLAIDYRSPRLIAYYGYAHGECSVRDDAPAIVADSDGWTWTAKVQPNLYQWTRLLFGEQQIPRQWLPEEFQQLKIHEKIRGADVTWRVVSLPAGDNFFMVGDAAMVLDPASSHGVLKAIMSAMMAAHLIVSEISNKITEKQAILHYSQWIKKWFESDIEQLSKLYAMLPNPPAWV